MNCLEIEIRNRDPKFKLKKSKPSNWTFAKQDKAKIENFYSNITTQCKLQYSRNEIFDPKMKLKGNEWKMK